MPVIRRTAQAEEDLIDLWLYIAQDNPGAVLARQLSHEGDALLRFRAGRYALGLEYYRSVIRYNISPANTGPAHADQVALSVLYTL